METTHTIEQAARVLMAHSPDAARLLGRRTPANPIFQEMYDRAATDVLADPDTDLTPEERSLVASFVTLAPSSDTRTYLLRVRLTETERAELVRLAEAADLSMSDYVRARLFEHPTR